MADKEPDWCARAEVLGALYYRATGYIAPGHDAPAAMGQEPGSPENRVRYANWCATSLIGAALDEIARQTQYIEELEGK